MESRRPEADRGPLTVLTTYQCNGGINPLDAHPMEYLQELQPGESPPKTYHCDDHNTDAPWVAMRNLDKGIETLQMQDEINRLRRQLEGFSDN